MNKNLSLLLKYKEKLHYYLLDIRIITLKNILNYSMFLSIIYLAINIITLTIIIIIS